MGEDALDTNAALSVSAEASGAGDRPRGHFLSAALAADAASFLVSTLTLAAMGRSRPRAAAAPGAGAEQPEGRAAAANTAGEQADLGAPGAAAPAMTFGQLLRTSGLLQAILVMIVVANISSDMAFEVALPTLARNQLAAGASGYGLLLGAYSAGLLLGSLGAGTLGRVRRYGLLLLFIYLVMAGFLALIPFAGGLPGTTATLAAAGFLNGLGNVSFITLVQQRLPRHLLGRIMGALMFASQAIYPLSVALGGVLVTRLGPVVIFPLSGILVALAMLYGFTRREVREL